MAGPRRAPLLFREHSETDKLYFVYKIFNKNVNLRYSAADGLLIKVTGRVVAGGLLKIKITFVLLPHPFSQQIHIPFPTTGGPSIGREREEDTFCSDTSLPRRQYCGGAPLYVFYGPPSLVHICMFFFFVHNYYQERDKIIIIITTTTTTITQYIIVL